MTPISGIPITPRELFHLYDIEETTIYEKANYATLTIVGDRPRVDSAPRFRFPIRQRTRIGPRSSRTYTRVSKRRIT